MGILLGLSGTSLGPETQNIGTHQLCLTRRTEIPETQPKIPGDKISMRLASEWAPVQKHQSYWNISMSQLKGMQRETINILYVIGFAFNSNCSGEEQILHLVILNKDSPCRQALINDTGLWKQSQRVLHISTIFLTEFMCSSHFTELTVLLCHICLQENALDHN